MRLKQANRPTFLLFAELGLRYAGPVLGFLLPVREKILEISFGEFMCPHCGVQTKYKHMERAKVERVHGICVTTETIAEYVECQRCKQRYRMDVLRQGMPTDIAQMIEGLRGRLCDGLALQDAERQLLDAGFEFALVKRYVSVAAGINFKKCAPCALTYRAEVMKCSKCGHVLPSK